MSSFEKLPDEEKKPEQEYPAMSNPEYAKENSGEFVAHKISVIDGEITCVKYSISRMMDSMRIMVDKMNSIEKKIDELTKMTEKSMK